MIRTGMIGSAAALIAVVALSVYAQGTLPADAQIPVHWGIDGEPDRYAGKLVALWSMPALIVGMTLLFALLPWIEPRRGHLLQSSGLYQTVWLGTMVIIAGAHAFMVFSGMGYELPVAQAVVGMVGVLLAAVGNLMGKTQSNFFLGIRTPWTLSSDEAWDKTHRLAGRLWVLGGLAIFAMAFMAPQETVFFVVMGIVIVIAAIPLVASYFFWKNASDRQTGEA